MENGDWLWDWAMYLDTCLFTENGQPLKLYLGLTPFFCLRNRDRDIVNCNAGRPEDMAEVHEFMARRLAMAGEKMIQNGADPVKFLVNERVYVKASRREIKIKNVMGTWSTEAVVVQLRHSNSFYYKVRWVTRGLGNAAPGTTSTIYYPWNQLRRATNSQTVDMFAPKGPVVSDGVDHEPVLPDVSNAVDREAQEEEIYVSGAEYVEDEDVGTEASFVEEVEHVADVSGHTTLSCTVP